MAGDVRPHMLPESPAISDIPRSTGRQKEVPNPCHEETVVKEEPRKDRAMKALAITLIALAAPVALFLAAAAGRWT
jgi:hypothetical protein